MPLHFCPLRSGSNGNALLAQGGGTRVLIDAGLSGREMERLLGERGTGPDTLQGILISHEHSDHIKGAGILSKRWNLPVYATEATWAAMEGKPGIDGVALKNRRTFAPGEDFYIRDLAISPFSIPHDAADPVGFSVLYGGRKLCVATDLGHIDSGWMRALAGANLVLLESNHDPDLLRSHARYPARLKVRILGRNGHLSNADCGSALTRLAQAGLTHVILGHLSGETNTPALAYETVVQVLRESGVSAGKDILVDLAYRDRTGGLYTIE